MQHKAVYRAYKNAEQHCQYSRFKHRALKCSHHHIGAGANNRGFEVDQKLIGRNITKRSFSPVCGGKSRRTDCKKQNGDHLPNKKTCFLLALFPLVGQNTLKNTLQKQNGCPYAKRKAQVFQKVKRAMAANIKHIRNL